MEWNSTLRNRTHHAFWFNSALDGKGSSGGCLYRLWRYSRRIAYSLAAIYTWLSGSIYFSNGDAGSFFLSPLAFTWISPSQSTVLGCTCRNRLWATLTGMAVAQSTIYTFQ